MKKIVILAVFLSISYCSFAEVTPTNGTEEVQAIEEISQPAETLQEPTAEEVKEEVTQPLELPAEEPKEEIEQDDTDPNGPWLICEIETEGLKNLKKKIITKEVKAKNKTLYEKDFISEDISTLSRLGYFDEILVDITKTKETEKAKTDGKVYPCHKITYIVEERPHIKEVKFEGRKKLSKGKIFGEMTLKMGDPFDLTILKQDIIKIKDIYRAKGYLSTEIDFETETLSGKNKVIVTLKINEGPRVKIKSVEFNGLSAFKYKKIRKKSKNKVGKVFKEEKLTEGKTKITDYYRNKGYYAFEILEHKLNFNEDKSEVSVVYNLSEGPKTTFGATTFSGNTIIQDEELKKEVNYKEGKTYKESKFHMFLRAVQEKYADKGYLKASINPIHTVTADGKLNTEIEITEQNVVYVGDIDVTGFNKTKKNVFTREILLKEGDVFSSSKIRRSQEKMMNLRFLDDVQLDITQNPYDPDKADLNFMIFEGKPGMLTMGAAYSSVDGLFGQLSVSHLNLFGRAQKLSLSWNFGARVLDYSLSWTTPWIKNHPTSLGFDAFNTRRIRPYSTSTTAYTEKRTGGRVRLGPRYNEDRHLLNFSYGYERIEIKDVEEQYQDQLSQGISDTSTLFTSFTMDTTDYMWDPTRGCNNSASLEFTGGPLQGDIDFYKIGLNSSLYHTLFNIGEYPFVWVLSNRFGFVDRHSNTGEVPVYEKYFLGGADTIRGYSSNGQIGPQNGGQVYYIFNTEIRFPILRERRKSIIQGAFFLDVGNAWRGLDYVNFEVGPDERQLKVGAGFGIRFTLPGFPIRLDWGYGFNHKEGQDQTEFYFTIGNPF